MKKIAAWLLVTLLVLPAAFAQETFRKLPYPLQPHPTQTVDDTTKIDLTHDEVNSPEGQAALQAFHTARAMGLLPQAKHATSYDIGERKNFNVRINIQRAGLDTTQSWAALEFELRDTSAVARIWVDPNELMVGNITEDEVILLSAALLRQTEQGSYNANQGIIANNNEVFGEPPNYDGDGIIDILIYDIKEVDPSQCCVLGLFSPQDINPNAPVGQGNQADVIYLDAKEGTASALTLFSVAAHEYQHLIHANYHSAPVSSVNEGLSEWAYLLNGYTPTRPYRYLSNPTEHNRPLITDTPIWQNSGADYERAGLFTNYVAERIGVLKTGSLTRASQSGAEAYTEVLASETLSLEELIVDFHIANYINDLAQYAPYGYANAFLQDIAAGSTTRYNGTATSVTSRVEASVEGGGVHYLVWDEVTDFEIFLDARAAPILLEFQRGRMRPHIILEHLDGTLDIRPLPPTVNFRSFTGAFARVTVVVPGVQAGSATSVAFDYEARWTDPRNTGNVATATYGDGQFNAFFPLGNGGVVATRFGKPAANAVLRSIDAPLLFLNQFSNTNVPTSAPRDFQLLFFDQDANREPGTELFRVTMDDPRPYRGQTSLEVVFAPLDLTPYRAQMAALPDTFFVAFADAGTDNNQFIIGSSVYTTSNVSFASPPTQDVWIPFWNLALVDDSNNRVPIGETALPLRLTFDLGLGVVSNEGVDEVPGHLTLDANYPNPFNPVTTIAYHLPQSEHVQLAVYDLLGQRIATLVEGIRAAGSHTVQVDASLWASGVYMYVLDVGQERKLRKMTLLK